MIGSRNKTSNDFQKSIQQQINQKHSQINAVLATFKYVQQDQAYFYHLKEELKHATIVAVPATAAAGLFAITDWGSLPNALALTFGIFAGLLSIAGIVSAFSEAAKKSPRAKTTNNRLTPPQKLVFTNSFRVLPDKPFQFFYS